MSLEHIENTLQGENSIAEVFNQYYEKWKGCLDEIDNILQSSQKVKNLIKTEAMEIENKKKQVIKDVENFRTQIIMITMEDEIKNQDLSTDFEISGYDDPNTYENSTT